VTKEALQKGSFACRDGGRHPGLLEGGVLRGASSESGPRSVRRVSRVSPHDKRRADDSGCPEGAEEGNVVGVRHKAHALEAITHGDVHGPSRTRPSLGPPTCARRSSLRSAGASSGWWGGREGITVGQARATGRNQHWGRLERTSRSSPRVTASARERAWHEEEKEGGRGLRPCEDRELRFGCPHVVDTLQKSVGGV
jgi:hypothetical protein